MKFHLLTIYILFQSILCFSQTEDTTDYSAYRDSIWQQYYLEKKVSIITGYQLQQNQFLELGIAIKDHGVNGPHSFTTIYGISNELKFISGGEFIWGLKTGIWAGDGYNMGLNLINYTDFEESTLRLRPEIGMGWNFFRLVYGYNSALTNSEFKGINKHNLAINFTIGIKTLKTIGSSVNN